MQRQDDLVAPADINSMLAGTDPLNRRLPGHADVGAARGDRYVGLFYFLWLGQHGTAGPYDNSVIRDLAPEAVHDPNHPLWGPLEAYHFWGQPLFGYYFADDPWVLRRHVQMITQAAVDFLVFDATNSVTYKNIYDVLLPILEEVRRQGYAVPRFAFYTNTHSSRTIAWLYNDIYKPGRYPELWFHWHGKPLIIGDPDGCSDEIRQFFTFRRNQWPNEAIKADGFPWIEFQRPQRVYLGADGRPEVISVSVAQHPTCSMSDTPFYGYGPNWGRSYHAGANDETPGALSWGYNIAEQWDFALAEDPQIIFVTGWNEWVAMRLPGPKERPILFVDQATLAFSRDIEPMKGGYLDCYYMQLIAHVRRFKGLAPPPPPSGQTINQVPRSRAAGYGGNPRISSPYSRSNNVSWPRCNFRYSSGFRPWFLTYSVIVSSFACFPTVPT